jgi:hypothetical protein
MTWEYHTTQDDASLTTLGLQGWELVAVLPGNGQEGTPTYYFKRPAPDLREEVTAAQKRRYYAQLGHALPTAEKVPG